MEIQHGEWQNMLVVTSQVSVKLASANINKIGRYKMKLTSRQRKTEKCLDGKLKTIYLENRKSTTKQMKKEMVGNRSQDL